MVNDSCHNEMTGTQLTTMDAVQPAQLSLGLFVLEAPQLVGTLAQKSVVTAKTMDPMSEKMVTYLTEMGAVLSVNLRSDTPDQEEPQPT